MAQGATAALLAAAGAACAMAGAICSSRNGTPTAVTAARRHYQRRDFQIRSHHVPLRFGSGSVLGDHRRRQRLEFATDAGKEADEEFEQQQARGLDADHHAFQRDDEHVADRQHDPIAVAPACARHLQNGDRQAGMGKREGADACERNGVDQQPQGLLDEFSGRAGQCRQSPSFRQRRCAEHEPDRAEWPRPADLHAAAATATARHKQ